MGRLYLTATDHTFASGPLFFRPDSIEAAKKLTETDPTIKAGVFIGEYHKWYGSAAIMEINRIHNTLTP